MFARKLTKTEEKEIFFEPFKPSVEAVFYVRFLRLIKKSSYKSLKIYILKKFNSTIPLIFCSTLYYFDSICDITLIF